MMDDESREAYEHLLAQRRELIAGRLADSARRAGRDPSEVLMLAVSKTVGIDEVVCAHRAGYDAFGENRPQELRRKVEAIAGMPEMQGVRYDMIGNLQTNKINQVIGCAHLIHSVSSLHLAEAISRRAVTSRVVVPVLLEVNVSGEASKSGLALGEARAALDAVMGLPGLDPTRLMTMAPAHEPQAARSTFAGLRALRDTMRTDSGLPLEVLSCGMSDDFGIAVEEGSTLVRLGRIVFDPTYDLGV